jgi:hypothetical protein
MILTDEDLVDLAGQMDVVAADDEFTDAFRAASAASATALRDAVAAQDEPAAQAICDTWMDQVGDELDRLEYLTELSAALEGEADPMAWRDLLILVASIMSEGRLRQIMQEVRFDLVASDAARGVLADVTRRSESWPCH